MTTQYIEVLNRYTEWLLSRVCTTRGQLVPKSAIEIDHGTPLNNADQSMTTRMGSPYTEALYRYFVILQGGITSKILPQ